MTSAPLRPREQPGDIRVLEAEADFEDIALDPPFVISGRPMTHLTFATVRLAVRTREGRPGRGSGGGILSVPWSWPRSPLSLEERDRIMRELVGMLAARLVELGGTGDPFTLWRPLEAELPGILDHAARRLRIDAIPLLAGLLALGALDNALHDAWSRTAGRSPYEMYTREHMNQDLGWVMPELAGTHPGDHLGPRRRDLPVQHALGVGDPLRTAGGDEAAVGPADLEDWIRTEGIAHLKLKLAGDPSDDARRIAQVHELAGHLLGATLSLDPNEAYTVEALEQMLDELSARSSRAAASITYLEQPFPRDTTVDPARMSRLTSRFPVLMDEGYADLAQLATLREQGWSGVVIKAAKGQSHALVTLAAARALGLRVAIQDLTTVGAALEHSLGLGAEIGADWPQIEYNSRQYAAAANARLAAQRPELVVVRDGHIRADRVPLGLYSS